MIVGISGLAGSGKDASADFIVKNHNFVKVALADPLKRICKEVYDFSDEQLWGPSAMRNAPDLRYVRVKKGSLGSQEVFDPEKGTYVTKPSPEDDIYLTPRYALQQLGTEWGRNCFNDTWVNLAIRVSQRLLIPGAPIFYSAKRGIRERYVSDPEARGVVISDVRFKNEISAIRGAGGILVRMMRGRGLEGEAANHVSETEQQEIPDSDFDFVIDNREWSLTDLEEEMNDLASVHMPTLLVKRKDASQQGEAT